MDFKDCKGVRIKAGDFLWSSQSNNSVRVGSETVGPKSIPSLSFRWVNPASKSPAGEIDFILNQHFITVSKWEKTLDDEKIYGKKKEE